MWKQVQIHFRHQLLWAFGQWEKQHKNTWHWAADDLFHIFFKHTGPICICHPKRAETCVVLSQVWLHSNTDLHPEICHLRQQVLEHLSVFSRQLRGQHHPHIIAWSWRHHVRKHKHTSVTQQHWRVHSHERVQPVTYLLGSKITERKENLMINDFMYDVMTKSYQTQISNLFLSNVPKYTESTRKTEFTWKSKVRGEESLAKTSCQSIGFQI